MNRITVISDSVEWASDFKASLTQYFETACFHLDELPDAVLGEFTFVDINLIDPAQVSNLKRWLERRPTNGRIIFGVNRESHLQTMQAYALGATDLLPRPVDGRLLWWQLSGGLSSIAKNPAESVSEFCEDISACVNALQNMFSAAMLGAVLDLQLLKVASAEIVARIEEEGLGHWLGVMRKHHSPTYQHSLIVTAMAVSFGQHLGFSNADKQRLASAGLLHDIGKARIPIEILEKAGPLNEAEIAIMRTHPELGLEALREAPALHPEMLDVVVHHHEYLDGSGYPHGLHANEISDLVRTITIADIFGALMERRPYKPPLAGLNAYQILVDMGPKLDKDLVREFRPLAQSVD
jgi:putative nucleotidyltransferase with HDIG domain